MQREKMQASSTEAPRASFRAKLLLIDDNVDALSYCAQVLQRAGYDVCCVGSISGAAPPPECEHFDLIVTRRKSPEFSGRSVLARVIEQQRETPVLVLGHGTDSAHFLEIMSLNARNRAGRAGGRFPKIGSPTAHSISGGENQTVN